MKQNPPAGGHTSWQAIYNYIDKKYNIFLIITYKSIY